MTYDDMYKLAVEAAQFVEEKVRLQEPNSIHDGNIHALILMYDENTGVGGVVARGDEQLLLEVFVGLSSAKEKIELKEERKRGN